MASSNRLPAKHAEEYFKLGLKEYEAKKYDAAVSAFDRVSLTDISIVNTSLCDSQVFYKSQTGGYADGRLSRWETRVW